MDVWIVQVGGRINSVWAEEEDAVAHVKYLVEVNGDQIAVHFQDYEVRPKGSSRPAALARTRE